ncbi:hypothetical protein GZ77_24670 [Endozoicomonas montiporae]|uniref:Threonine/serine exporter-like N-terminal domain-containing protein n=2 Tax=Endozoicomonas montiporae TaxID=1027273 RepID=A0A081MZT3_9GAMM|nr:threonine/serine exporter family protein [Endozoicomonas montiporae]AMO54602.1 hypothetical protein EZMO1_0350 [Endozoicomonas montiporae CL-33]KEQ11706.1 hypothetical protein GZ77_24670 [Endozoicomonas montiporae]
MKSDGFSQKRDFILELGKALHQFGTPAFRLEAHLNNVTKFLGLDGYFLLSPTSMTFSLWEHAETEQQNYNIRVHPGELDLGRLAEADELVEELVSGSKTLDEALTSLRQLTRKPAPYSQQLTMLAFGVSAGAFAMLMRASWIDIMFSTLAGLMVYCLIVLVERKGLNSEILEPLSSIMAALFAAAVSVFYPEIYSPIVILSSIIVFIPGLAITMGLKDLAARHLTSGTARVMDGIMCLFKLYFGTTLGMALGAQIFGSVEHVNAPAVPEWTLWLAVPTLSMTLVVIFKSRLKDAPWGVLSAIVAFVGSLLGTVYLGDSLGLFVGAVMTGMYSNIYSRITNAPSSVVLLHGVVLLVPGSKAYITLNEVISGESMMALSDLGPQTFLIFMSITAGLIFANSLIPSRKTL